MAPKKDEEERYAPWCKPIEDAFSHFSSSEAGLTSQEAQARVELYGPNELEKEPPTPLWKLVLEQFDDALVKILLLAAMVSFVLAVLEEDTEEGLRAYIEPFVILLILVLNAIVGVWQEANAENALEALKELQPSTAKVERSGVLMPELPASELVPGDVIHLVVGDKVPADCRVIKINTATLRVEQASLTGALLARQHTQPLPATWSTSRRRSHLKAWPAPWWSERGVQASP